MGIIISLPVSLLLFWLVLKLKKADPFPKGGLWRLLIAGALSTVVAAILSQTFSLIIAAIRIGPANVAETINRMRTDMAAAGDFLQSLSFNKKRSPLMTLLSTMITAGLLEELCKYYACRAAIRKKGMVRTWMDALICFTAVGLTFQILENLVYGGSYGIIVAILRNLAPGHFIFGVIMGWYYGKYLIAGEKTYRFQCILWPALIHTLYDTGLNLMPNYDADAGTGQIYIAMGLLAFVGAFVMAVIIIVKLVRWHKDGKLDTPIPDASGEPAG